MRACVGLGRFGGEELEVALEATTGWRFVAEELRRVGAGVHLGEPAATSALRGNKKRPKTDWADAKHLRELLMIERLPESGIPPDHLLDLRSKSGCVTRLSISAASGSSAFVPCSSTTACRTVPSFHLLSREGLAWLEQAQVPDAAREQITVAIAMTEALETQIAPLDKQLRTYARRQAGCKASMAHYGSAN